MTDTSYNLPPARWGAQLWQTMYSIAYLFPDAPSNSQRNAAIAFFSSLAFLIPCDECRQHYADLIREVPINKVSMANKFSLLRWLEIISNSINDRLGKERVDHEAAYEVLRKNVVATKVVVPVGDADAPKAPVKKGCGCGGGKGKGTVIRK